MLIIEIALGVALGLLVYHQGNAILRALSQYWKKVFYAGKRCLPYLAAAFMILGLFLAAINSWNWLWAQDWSSPGLWHRLSAEDWYLFSDNFYAVEGIAIVAIVALGLLAAAVQRAKRRKTNPEQTQPEKPAIQVARMLDQLPQSGSCPLCGIQSRLSHTLILQPYNSKSFYVCVICADCDKYVATFKFTPDEWVRCMRASLELPEGTTLDASKLPTSQRIAQPDLRSPN